MRALPELTLWACNRGVCRRAHGVCACVCVSRACARVEEGCFATVTTIDIAVVWADDKLLVSISCWQL